MVTETNPTNIVKEKPISKSNYLLEDGFYWSNHYLNRVKSKSFNYRKLLCKDTGHYLKEAYNIIKEKGYLHTKEESWVKERKELADKMLDYVKFTESPNESHTIPYISFFEAITTLLGRERAYNNLGEIVKWNSEHKHSIDSQFILKNVKGLESFLKSGNY